ncbi:site-specific integrase [Lentilactobacillus buchneri]|uniref:site-specific integrase n=1 Tax=Lentilactobacillus buchneri TaxID=1581 RepID=UPI0011EF79BF|nr:site-specific integrase [Lentilactobacillus buchneri]
MLEIKKYSNKKGETLYQFQVYLGVDEQTGKKRVTRRRGFKTERAAKLALSRLQSQFEQNGYNQQKNILFSEVYEEWYQAYINTVRVSTYARTRKMFDNHILPAFGDKRIRTITVSQVQLALNQWFKMAPVSGYKRWFQYTTSVFDYAIKLGYMPDRNPAKMVTIPHRKKKPGDKPQNFWDRDQLNSFLQTVKNDGDFEKYTLFRVLGYTGVRRGECLALVWADVNFSKAELRINKTLTQGLRGETIVQPPKTTAGYRTIPLDKMTVDVLKNWRKKQRKIYLSHGINVSTKSQLIFANTKNGYKGLDTPHKWLKPYLDNPKNKLKFITVHGFRKSYCTALVSAGLPVKEVQRRMGHDDVQTTLDVYSFVTKEQIDKSTQLFEQYMNG